MNSTINIFRDEVILAIFEKEEPLLIKIKSQALADTFRTQFDVMWKIAKK